MAESNEKMEFMYIGVGIIEMETMGVHARNKEILIWHCHGRQRLTQIA